MQQGRLQALDALHVGGRGEAGERDLAAPSPERLALGRRELGHLEGRNHTRSQQQPPTYGTHTRVGVGVP